ncbi:MAG TPA: hypothetical protein VE226_02200 [Nitrososphaeraceae archaeon]|nr:hypothetical protein [Nitrososphaeraceae archaeon]
MNSANIVCKIQYKVPLAHGDMLVHKDLCSLPRRQDAADMKQLLLLGSP